MKLSKRIENLENSMLEESQDEEDYFEDHFDLVPPSHREQLIDFLYKRRLGAAGQRLLAWLKHGGDLTPELEQLLRKACSMVPAEVFIRGEGLKMEGCLDPDRIIKEMPEELFEQARLEAAHRFGDGYAPLPGDEELLKEWLTASGMQELKERLAGKPTNYGAGKAFYGPDKLEWHFPVSFDKED